MKTQLAFGSLLLATSQLVAPAALAQVSGSGGVQSSTPPSGATVEPTIDAEQTPEATEEQIETSTPGAEFEDSGEIVVRGRNIPNVIRSTPQVVSVLSAADIARTGEGDIAGALQRVTGLSVVGNGFVFVRGLGDRYSSSLLNGSPLPSPEPLRRVVPLDIFPTNVIASALVQKSYSANYPGEFGGGVINLTTRAVPNEAFVQVGGSVAFDTFTTSNLGYVYDGGEADYFGFDSGERNTPASVVNAGRNRLSTIGSADLTSFSNAPTTLLQQNPHIPPNHSYEFSFGDSMDIDDVRLGVIAGGGFSNSWRTRDAINQFAIDDDGQLSRDFRTVTTDNRVIVNGLYGVGAEFGDHKIRWTNLYIHDTVKQASLGEGGQGNNFDVINGNQSFKDQNTNWFERELFDTQGVGEFKFGDFSVDVRGSFANTKRNSPYERYFRYQYAERGINDYINNLGTLTPATIAFSKLNEELWSGQGDLSYKFNTVMPLRVSAGYAYTDTDRQSYRYSFQYQGPGGTNLPDVLAQLRPDYLLSDDTILNGCRRWVPGFPAGANCIELRNTSASSGAAEYDAELTIHAGYGQVDFEPMESFKVNAGVRYETAKQNVDVIGGISTKLENDYWLPAATFTWNFAQSMQLRIHGSKTIARPQFRELAPQLYQDFESNRQFFGNPLLKDSTLKNFEARAEWFFARDQRLTVAGFHKKITNPTETVAFYPGGSSTPQVGFSYAPSARLYGAEVELQKYFNLDWMGDFFATRRLLVIGNYTFTKSELEVGNQLVPSPLQGAVATFVPANNLFVDGDPLVGQSDHLVNFQLGIEDTASLSQITFLVNYASERVTNRGPVSPGSSTGRPQPNVIENPGWRFDIVARQGFALFGTEVEVKLEGRNLTNRRYEEFQSFENGKRVDINTYDVGRTFSIGASVKF